MRSLETRLRHVRSYSKKIEKDLSELRDTGGLVTPITDEYLEALSLIEYLFEKYNAAKQASNTEELKNKILSLKRKTRKGGLMRKGAIGEEREAMNRDLEELANSL